MNNQGFFFFFNIDTYQYPQEKSLSISLSYDKTILTHNGDDIHSIDVTQNFQQLKTM